MQQLAKRSATPANTPPGPSALGQPRPAPPPSAPPAGPRLDHPAGPSALGTAGRPLRPRPPPSATPGTFSPSPCPPSMPAAPPPARAPEPAAPASPYRQIAALEAPLPSRLPPPARPRAPLLHPRLRAVALIGSLLAHAALLAASAVTEPAAAAPVQSQPVSGFDPYLVHAEPFPFYCPFPPDEPLAACFTRAELRAAGECTNTPYCQLHGEPYGHDARHSWAPIPYPFLEFNGDEVIASDRLLIDLSTCASVARQSGWTGRGHVFVRVTVEAGGGAVAQAFARDSAADNPGLLCCLRNAQLALASTMRPGTTVRYDFSSGPEGIELTPPPL